MTWTHEYAWTIPAPSDRLFAALTSPEELRRWFAESVEIGTAVGGPYRFWGRYTLGLPTAALATQRITRFEPGRALGFDWTLNGSPTMVTLSLAPADDEGTRLSVRHEVRGPLGGIRERELIDDWWRLVFGNLAMHLAGGEGVLRPDFADPAPEVRIAIVIEAPPAAVFRALLEPEALARWFGQGGTVSVDPKVGGRFELGWKYQIEGKDVLGGPTKILELIPDRRLVVDWTDWRGDPTVTGQTIAFELEPVAQGTRVTLVHAGFVRPVDISDYPFGWPWFLGKLRDVAEDGVDPGGVIGRRTS